MKFRRQESFRYTFNSPIDCLFRIIKIDDDSKSSEFGKGQIIDISPSGLKMLSSLNLSPSHKKIEIEVRFTIDNRPYEIPGMILWQKRDFLKNEYSYGIKLDSSEEISSTIIESLKKHAEQTLKKKL
ncbi:PilZ domain-containing protein [Schinkia sp. CFF1]